MTDIEHAKKYAEESISLAISMYNPKAEIIAETACLYGLTYKNKRIVDLEAQNELIKNSDTLCKLIGEQKRNITKLEEQIEKMKSQYNYAFNQLCESREIICLMLSQYKNKKEIDYFAKERGEKLLKQGVYKYDK